jgi:hypothetical protein
MIRGGSRLAAAVLCLALAATPLGVRAWAQAVFAGPEFQVNTYTTQGQLRPGVSADGSGNFVVVWESPDGNLAGVFGQRFGSLGTPLGAEFQINTFTIQSQIRASVAMHGSGSFVVTWDTGGGFSRIFAQRFDGSGTPQGGEFQVSSYTTTINVASAVGSDAGGNFVVVWHGIGPGEVYCCDVLGRRFNSMGTPQGGQFQVNTYTTDSQGSPQVAVKASGDFVVVWRSEGQGIAGQRFDSAGAPQGSEFPVASGSSLASPGIAMDATGSFVVVWLDQDSDGVYARRFDSSGTAQGVELQIDAGAAGAPAISADGAGDFVVAWSASDGDDDGVFARVLNSSGALVGSEFQVNTFTTGGQSSPSVVATGPGNFVVAWDSRPVVGFGTCGGGTCVGQGQGCFGDLGDLQCAVLCGGVCIEPPPPSPGHQDGDSAGVFARRLVLCTSCANGDGCCAPGCNHSSDNDCAPTLPVASPTGWGLLVSVLAVAMVWAFRRTFVAGQDLRR